MAGRDVHRPIALSFGPRVIMLIAAGMALARARSAPLSSVGRQAGNSVQCDAQPYGVESHRTLTPIRRGRMRIS